MNDPVCAARRQPIAAPLLLLLSLPALLAQEPMQPFVIDHFLRQDSKADLTFLLDAPAGKHGFIRDVGGHLAHDRGRIRFWGVNVTGWVKGSALLPPKEDAALWAAELGRLGINCVRFHFLDRRTNQIPRGLIDGALDHTRAFDQDQFDRLDFFIFELKKRGIYSDLNLNVGRDYKPGDEVPDSQLITQAKAMTYIGPRLLELQREYARMLLTHFEPVTGWLLLRNIDGALAMTVTALDGSARPLGQPVRARRLEAGWEFPLGGTVTTTYLIEPVR